MRKLQRYAIVHGMVLQALELIITAAGGRSRALEYGPALLEKINGLEPTGRLRAL